MEQNFKLALIGHPLGHSLSPILHNTALKKLGLEGSYELLDTPPEDLISRIKYLKNNGYFGFNVTIPFKVPLTLFLSTYAILYGIDSSSFSSYIILVAKFSIMSAIKSKL